MNTTSTADLMAALERPGTADILRRCLAEQARHAAACARPGCDYTCGREHWSGFEWSDVRAPAARLNGLVIEGVLDQTYRSHSSTSYKLHDVAATIEALQRFDAGDRDAPPEPLEIPTDLFDIIEGQDRVKNLLHLALAAPRPVHVLFEGPPGSAKSMFLEELNRLPDARYALGGTTSRAGIVDFLLDARPRFLIVDEIDKMGGADASALLSVMEGGRLSRLKRHADQVSRLHLWVFAAANRSARMSPELLSRFWRIRLKQYTDEEFRAVVVSVLTKREGVDGEMAWYIARMVLPRSRDPRDAVKVARLGTSKADIDLLVTEIQT
jgi:Holliday junction DNA helicase RuvB